MTSSPSNSSGAGGIVMRRSCDGDRHRERRIAALVGLDEAGEQRALGVARLAGGPLGRVERADARPASRVPAAARCSRPRPTCRAPRRSRLAGQPSTSRAIRVARWRGGSTWSAARNASSIVSRVTTTDSGSSSGGAISSSSTSGYGVIHGTSRIVSTELSRRALRRMASRQTFVAILYSHARTSALPSKPIACPPRPQERLLHGVVGLVERGQHPVAVDVQLAPVSLGEGRERGLPTGERGRDRVGHAATSSSFTTWTFQSRLTSWTSQVLPSGSWNGMNVA